MTRARRSRVKKVSVRTSVNISSRKQSIEIVGERMDDASTTRGPATRKERFNHFNNSKESKEAHVSRLTLLSRLLSCNTHPRFSVLSFFTASRSSSLVAFLLFRLPCDISLDRCRESSFSNRVTKYYKQRFVKRAASFACSSCSSCLCTLFLLYALPLRFPFAARSSYSRVHSRVVSCSRCDSTQRGRSEKIEIRMDFPLSSPRRIENQFKNYSENYLEVPFG